jgi:hypothetical protein
MQKIQKKQNFFRNLMIFKARVCDIIQNLIHLMDSVLKINHTDTFAKLTEYKKDNNNNNNYNNNNNNNNNNKSKIHDLLA